LINQYAEANFFSVIKQISGMFWFLIQQLTSCFRLRFSRMELNANQFVYECWIARIFNCIGKREVDWYWILDFSGIWIDSDLIFNWIFGHFRL